VKSQGTQESLYSKKKKRGRISGIMKKYQDDGKEQTIQGKR
jgi:hypothetical protein